MINMKKINFPMANLSKVFLVLMLLITPLLSSLAKSKTLPYQDVNLTPQERATDLLGRLSVDDKVHQLMAVIDGSPISFDEDFLNDEAQMKEVFGKSVYSVQPLFLDIKETVKRRNSIQKYLLEETQWGIPTIFVDEGQHGLMKIEATVFPMAIGLSCSWDKQLFEEVYSLTALEMRSRGAQHALSPVIDVCRDPRWGRVEETYGEDPYLCGMLGIAAVKGFQGSTDGSVADNHVAATLKHFCGHGQPQGGLNQAPANFSERSLRTFHFPPFEMVVKEAKPVSIMPSYNEIDGVPSHMNHWLLNDVLRDEWGFEGVLVSDWNAITQLNTKHFVAKDKKDAAMKAFNAGIQYELPRPNYYTVLPELLEEGKISITDVDKAVYESLLLKFQLGLFDNPYVDVDEAIAISKRPESRDLALKAAHESIVLLKNDERLLPLNTDKYKKIAVVGPCANHVYTGGYSGEPYQKITILEGIKEKVGQEAEVLFAQGCRIVENVGNSQSNWKAKAINFTPREDNLKMIAEAVEVAREAEVIIVAVGETEHLCREAWSKDHIGDNMTLDLLGEQQELVDAMLATGKPVVVYLMNGRPLTINDIAEKAPAIIEGWYMGQETGTAVADILFGDVNPSGKLTITFPKSVGQLPMFYNHKPSAQFHNYISQDVLPLYPFGYGLSYTTFSYSNMKLSADLMQAGEEVTVSVDVTNSGKMKGDEIVQLYIRDKVSSVTRPVKELKGFERISLEAGETKAVEFTIDASKLAFWDYNMEYTVEAGEFEIMIGQSSADLISKILSVE